MTAPEGLYSVPWKRTSFGYEKFGVIQDIEHLGPELQIQSLTDSHPLQKRSVDVEQTRTTQRSACHVSEGALERQHEGVAVEPLIGFSQNHFPLKVRIPVRYFGNTGIAGTRRIRAGQRRKGESARNPNAPIPLPAADQLVRDTSGAASEALPIPKRQQIAVVPAELVGEAVG